MTLSQPSTQQPVSNKLKLHFLLYIGITLLTFTAASPKAFAQAPYQEKAGQPLALPVSAPLTSAAAPTADLLAAVRDHVSRLRAAPLPHTSTPLHQSTAQQATEELKVLHDWKGEQKSAGWIFSVKVPGK